jgi:glutamate-ammonia-ligase adenylyltransferase
LSEEIQNHPGFSQIERLLSGGMPSTQAAGLLTSLGVSDLERCARSLQSLALHPSFPREDMKFLGQFLESLGETFEPERALANLERILASRENPDAFLSALRRSAGRRSIVLTLAGGSQFLTETVLRHPEFLDWLLRPSTLRGERAGKRIFSELWGWVRKCLDETNGPAGALRRFCQREYLRIGIGDLLRTASMGETTMALSDLADATLEAALRVAEHELRARFGKPRYRVRGGGWRTCEFAVIGMGKLGGRELNFSSDIDLLFVYTSDDGETAGVRDPYSGRRSGKISNHEFSVRLAQRLIQLMTVNTGEGHVFRIDTRLRPEGSQGALAYSLRSCEVYYESWGETWERQALIKARLCAGSASLGENFEEMIRPFIYRRTLDISALDEIGRIKDRINSSLAASGNASSNIKLGEGGIREIEFIIQSYQLIYGGKEPHLRTQNSLRALSAIKDLGLMPIEDCDGLAEAYIFLRDVEHRVQVTHGIQTHDLPSDRHGLEVLARKMGFEPSGSVNERQAFESALNTHQELVARIFEDLFRKNDGPEPAGIRIESSQDTPPESARTLEDSLSPADLAPYNFADPAAASTLLRLLRNGEPFQRISARAKRLFDEILPRLLYTTLDLPDPDRAIACLYRFSEIEGGREAVFSLMGESERVFEALLKVFGSSDYLSEIVIHQPGLFDSILREDSLGRAKSREEIFSAMESAAAGSSLESRLASLSEAKRAEECIIGIRSLLGEADILDTLAELTALADAVLTVGLSIAEEEMRSLFGEPQAGDSAAGFAAIGLGKLGGAEMNFGSDLDLIFTYGGSAGTTSGRDGNRDSAYGGAESWERQALCRARFIAGSPEVGEAFMALAGRFVYETEVPDNFASQVAHMRGRMERELARETDGNIDIKLGRGGITDIDFAAQYLQITHGAENPSLRRPDTLGAIRAFREENLLSAENTDGLIGAYRFLRLLENRLRIVNSQPLHTLPRDPDDLETLARRMGFEDDEEGSSRAKLLSAYDTHTQRVRGIFEEIVGVVDSPFASQ